MNRRAIVAVPVLVVAGMLVAAIGRRRRRRLAFPRRGTGGYGTSGVREPRRPLVPSAWGAAEIPLPE